MASLWLLIPISGLLLGIACWAFFYAVNHGQMDHLEDIRRKLPDDEP